MAFLIKSAGLVTTGTTGADLFSIENGAGQKSTVLGLAGSDNVQALAGLATATAFVINAAGDKDTISISGATTIMSSMRVKPFCFITAFLFANALLDPISCTTLYTPGRCC